MCLANVLLWAILWLIEQRTAWYSLALVSAALTIYQVQQSVWPWWSLALPILLLMAPPTLLMMFYLACASVTRDELS